MDASLLTAHVERFNAGVRTGDFSAMVAALTPEAVMAFVGAPAGPFSGREEIAAAYAAHPPRDEIVLLTQPAVEGDAIVADYAWASAGARAGRIVLTPRGDAIARLVVTFE